MKKYLLMTITIYILCHFGITNAMTVGIPNAMTVNLFVDSAPNVYGSPNYGLWETDAFQKATNGSFINMANSSNPANIGSTFFDIRDEVVYSFGDLGKRLSFIYWLPNQNIEALITKKFQINILDYWGSEDAYDVYSRSYVQTWVTPSSWKNFNDGVIGIGGMAWWGAYNVNTPEALANDIADWGTVWEKITFSTQYVDNGQTYTDSLSAERNPVPEPATMLLLGSGLVGLAGYGRRKIRKSHVVDAS